MSFLTKPYLTKPTYRYFSIPLSYFSLKTLRDFCDLNICGKFANKKGDLNEIISRPYLTVLQTLFVEFDNYGCYAYFHETQEMV